MMNKELAQIAVLKELDKKTLQMESETDLLKIFYVDDLYKKHRDIFHSTSSLDEIALLMNSIDEISHGRYELVDISRSVDDRSPINSASFDKNGNIFQTNMYWEFEFHPEIKSDSDKPTLQLSAKGLLSVDSKSILLKNDSLPFKLLKFLMMHKGPTQTYKIAESLSASDRGIRETVRYINSQIAPKVDLDNLVVGKGGHGYMLRSDIKPKKASF